MFSAFVVASNEGYFIDTDGETEEILSHLKLFKLRSKVLIEDVSDKHTVLCTVPQSSHEKFPAELFQESFKEHSITYKDTRFDRLGWRHIAKANG